MNTKTLKVNDVSLYREIANNLVDPLELIRESISNSNDAQSSEITIRASLKSLQTLTM